jgi:hypothetical protein
MKTESKKLENGDLAITLIFDAHDQICLDHDLLSIQDWFFQGPSQGKIDQCKKRMIEQHKKDLLECDEFQKKTMAEVNEILKDEKKTCEMITSLSVYKNRLQREISDIRT